MPEEFIGVLEETDPDVMAQDTFLYLESKVPDWSPSDGQLDTWMLSAAARIIATLKDTASQTRKSIFRTFVVKVFGILPYEGVRSKCKSTWELIDTEGHTIPEGTKVGVPNSAGELTAFETVEDIVVPLGSNKTTAGQVELQSVEASSAPNGIAEPGTKCVLEDQYPWVAEKGIALTNSPEGGVTEETDEAFLDRAVEEVKNWGKAICTPTDFERTARFFPGVQRALAINLYNPVSKTYGHEKTITVVVVNEKGEAVGAIIEAALKEFLQEAREINFEVFVIPPEYEKFDVEFKAVHWEGFEPENVKQRVETALKEFLSPANWGKPPFGNNRTWYKRETIKINDLISVVGSVEGVKDVEFVKLRKHSIGSYETNDISMVGPAVLPELITVVGSVS